MSNKKWAQQQTADAAEFVHEGVMSRVDRRFPSQDALISAHNENAIDIQCKLIESLTQIAENEGVIRVMRSNLEDASAQIAALTKQVEEYRKAMTDALSDAAHWKREANGWRDLAKPNLNESTGRALAAFEASEIGKITQRAEKADVELATAKAQVDVYKQVMSELRAELAELRSWMRQLTTAMSNKEWADSLTTDIDAAALEEQITAVHSELAELREGSTVTYRVEKLYSEGVWVNIGSIYPNTEDRARVAAGSDGRVIEITNITRERILDEKGEG